ncbi:MAG TPA: arylsulfatase [Planctomycetaceae bacterium]|jgi:arylsulfatase|nr:arylsulfatase [Planctomycetaceae bacterium]
MLKRTLLVCAIIAGPCALIVFALLIGPAAVRSRPPSAAPNIVLIVADDLGFSDIGCYGAEVATPNLDQLATRGVRFTQFYNAARCSPSRAALLTGLYPHQAGVGHLLEDWQPPGYTAGLNERCATIAELLQAGGYSTYHVGKWHVGGVAQKNERNHPLNRGFDRAYGTGGGGNHFALGLYDDRKYMKAPDDFYSTDAFADRAADFIRDHQRQHADRPFFLHLCFTAPHFPLQARPEDIERYRGKYASGWDALRQQRYTRQKELGVIDAHWPLSPRDSEATSWEEVPKSERAELELRMSIYAAMIDCLDRGIGQVLSEIRQSGAEENTVVIFVSDNGASAEAVEPPWEERAQEPTTESTTQPHRSLGAAWANAANTPFRGYKMWLQEGGISTPLIISWPLKLKHAGSITPQVGHLIDLMPTCLDLAQVKYPQVFQGRELTPLAGRSLVPILQGQSPSPRTLAWEHEGNRALRDGDLKLVADFRGPWQLYDLKADRTETHDLAAQRPNDVIRLSAMWQVWADHVGVVDWQTLPGSSYRPSSQYRKKSEPLTR